MAKGFKVTTKYHTHDPEKAKNLISGSGLLQAIKDSVDALHKKIEHPFNLLEGSDFNGQDPTVNHFNSLGGPVRVIKIMSGNNPMNHLQDLFNNLSSFRLSEHRKALRHAYVSLASMKDDEAAQMERIASKIAKSSPGHHQLEALNAIQYVISDSSLEMKKIANIAKGQILSANIEEAKETIKLAFDAITPTKSTRLAYTSLSTQGNEPFLLCPKGKVELGHAVPMEVSKCRENCIDSRVAKDGSVTCAYQDWLRVTADTHAKMENRLNVHRHPDNAKNLLNLSDGNRENEITEGEIGYEARFEAAKSHKNKENFTSIEESLGKTKPADLGRRNEEKSTKTAQTHSDKVLEDQLPRTNKHDSMRDVESHNEFDTEATIEENLNESDNLISRRDERFQTYAEELLKKQNAPKWYIEQILKDAGDGDDMTVSQHLNKTAKKEPITREEELESKRTNEDVEKTIEELLAEDADWGHQYSDDDLKEFASELGLDSLLEDSRED
jgi:hypothetical protein